MVITRFPPSPTGHLHIGSARTALFNWLYTKKMGGEIVLRIEDTDIERATPSAVEVILDGMKWLGLTWNKGPFYQSQRFDRYAEVMQQLLQQGDAYYCDCTSERLTQLRDEQMKQGKQPKYDRHCRNKNLLADSDTDKVIRFKTPTKGSAKFNDLIHGKIEIQNSQLDDFVIARSGGAPTYNLCVVVDDSDMNITHVLRGDDHINNTPKQIHIFNALKQKLPVFSHMPMIYAEDGKRLSKRHGAISVLEFKKLGILPQALLNYLVRMGWSHGDQEIFDLDEMIELFDVADINSSPATFNMDKLLWLNQHYLAKMDIDSLGQEIAKRLNTRGVALMSGPKITQVVELMCERAQTLEEMADKVLYFYQDVTQYNQVAVKKHITRETIALLGQLESAFVAIEQWNKQEINLCIKTTAKQNQVKFPQLAQPLRIALSGSDTTPSIDITAQLVGKQRVIERIRKTIDFFLRNNP